MGVTRMANANTALIAFLNQLPDTGIFNVISYGSDFNYMFSESKSVSSGSYKSQAITDI